LRNASSGATCERARSRLFAVSSAPTPRWPC